ncbi:hypothetical protein BC939DRAFT_271555 [Gamsiella multidivaricata]|uniref:uncharacterized protein n=1 Tax=Gamsiella multidivaricata TaxID=101098 RepID=UPI0022208570|nr:uncharacterized protein BC939DRAFT_271555 [Gamsiella multidivaricata]KAI7819074.1 hypothetical protein BC939DRAFT_271555 [Gamsiella multidivaricata]
MRDKKKKSLMRRPISQERSHFLSNHQLFILDALNREPAVQVLLEEKEVAGESVINTKRQSETFANNAAEPSSSSGAITDAAPAEERLSLQKVPMDEGYDRPSLPSMDGDKEEGSVAETTEERALESNVSESKDTVQEADSDEKKLTATDVSPADVALPLSPVPNEAAMPSITVPEISATPPVADAASGTTSGTAASPSSQSVSPKKQYSADVLLPLLIFSVVKSNPPMLISNLRYIQRFKVQDHLTGELAYCLTNMMAVVSFLETLDPQALGLSNDIRVVSDMSDIQATPGKPQPVPRINLQDGIDHTKALGHKVSQEIVGAAEEGIKVISDVVQDGYSKFFGRFLTTTDGTLPFGNSKAGVLNRSTRAMSAASSLAATAAASAAAEEERKRKASEEKNRGLVGLVSPAGVTSNVTVLSVDGTAGGAGVEKTSPHDSAMEAAARERVLEYMRNSEGPQLQFMACTDSGDLRLNDIKSLLDDYQRIGKMLEEIKRLA